MEDFRPTPQDAELFDRIRDEIAARPADYSEAGAWLDGRYGREGILSARTPEVPRASDRLGTPEDPRNEPVWRLNCCVVDLLADAAAGELDLTVLGDHDRLKIARRIVYVTWLITDPETGSRGVGASPLEAVPWTGYADGALGRAWTRDVAYRDPEAWRSLLSFAWGAVVGHRRRPVAADSLGRFRAAVKALVAPLALLAHHVAKIEPELRGEHEGTLSGDSLEDLRRAKAIALDAWTDFQTQLAEAEAAAPAAFAFVRAERLKRGGWDSYVNGVLVRCRSLLTEAVDLPWGYVSGARWADAAQRVQRLRDQLAAIPRVVKPRSSRQANPTGVTTMTTGLGPTETPASRLRHLAAGIRACARYRNETAFKQAGAMVAEAVRFGALRAYPDAAAMATLHEAGRDPNYKAVWFDVGVGIRRAKGLPLKAPWDTMQEDAEIIGSDLEELADRLEGSSEESSPPARRPPQAGSAPLLKPDRSVPPRPQEAQADGGVGRQLGAKGDPAIIPPPALEPGGLTVTQVSKITGLGTGQVSRLCDGGTLITNGKTGRARRIDAASVTRLELKLQSEKRVKLVERTPLA